jgi:hypothetical protein
MPWTPDEAERHTHKATTPELQQRWAKVANERLENTGTKPGLSGKPTPWSRDRRNAVSPAAAAWQALPRPHPPGPAPPSGSGHAPLKTLRAHLNRCSPGAGKHRPGAGVAGSPAWAQARKPQAALPADPMRNDQLLDGRG